MVLGAALLCGLGVWQVQRLHWKTALLADMDAALGADPMAFELTGSALAVLPASQTFVRGFAEGVYLHGKTVLLGPRPKNGAPGYRVVTPFETLAGSILLVDRGWIPDALKNGDYTQPAESLIVSGTARRPPAYSRFVPPNDPGRGAWFRLDTADIAAAQGLGDVLPFILYPDESAGSYPETDGALPRPPNNHLMYAVFWFGMAGLLILVFLLRFTGRRT